MRKVISYFHKLGIATQISLVFSGLAIVLFFLTGIFFIYQEKMLISELMEQRRDSLEDTITKERQARYNAIEKEVNLNSLIIANSMAEYLYNLDPGVVKPPLEAFMKVNWLIGIVVFDDFGSFFAAVYRNQSGLIEFSDTNPPDFIDQISLQLREKEVFYTKKKVGIIKLYYTLEGVKKNVELVRNKILKQILTEKSNAEAQLHKIIMTQVMIAIGIIAVLVLVTFLQVKSVVRPILRIASCIHALGNSNLRYKLDKEDQERGDEIGIMARGCEITRVNLLSILLQISNNADSLVAASDVLKDDSAMLFDFAKDMSGDSEAVVHHAENNGNYVATIAQATSQISSNVNNINQKIDQLSKNIATVAFSASDASINMSELSANLENISHDIHTVNASVETMSANLSSVSRNSSETVKISEDANIQINKSLDTLTKLQNASDEINSAVQIISTISTQTNLLALNATIEAVRGGEAGIRFGVVAEEVKNLALKTSNANNEIGKLISKIREYINITVASIHETSQVIGRVLENNIVIGDSINRQSDASNAITMSVDSIAKSSEESTHKIKQADEGLKDIKVSASEVASVAKESAINISETAVGISEIAESSEAASQGIGKLIADIKNIQYATTNITSIASGNRENAIKLAVMAEKLKQTISAFQLQTPPKLV